MHRTHLFIVLLSATYFLISGAVTLFSSIVCLSHAVFTSSSMSTCIMAFFAEWVCIDHRR
ncbi:hypothetical protein BX666DRAFT_1988114 [Dichotomocladium elegans]|nr:hypothetical protein BX666DRAFT_1988114 [Dichotomocladium elegans]